MIKNILYLILLYPLYAFNFDYSQNIPEVIIDGNELNNAFLGGTNYAIVRWVDWDQDNDSDLFLLDEDGHIRYYQNIGTES